MPGWIVVVVLMWVLASLLVGVTMILLLRRREGPPPSFELGEPPLVSRALAPRVVWRVRAACDRCARRSRIPRTRA